jgi:N-acetylneuraminic acid mutarotase
MADEDREWIDGRAPPLGEVGAPVLQANVIGAAAEAELPLLIRPPVVIRPSNQALLRQQAPSPVHGHGPHLRLPGPPNPIHGYPVHHYNALSINVPEREAEEDPLESPQPTGWAEVEVGAGSVPPSARSLHAAALLNGTMYCFGGYDGSQRVNTFHAFSFAEKRWSPVLPSANSPPPPSPRDRHVAVAFGNSIYIHAGFDGTSRVADLWSFDFSTMMWREIVALQGRPPSPRHSHSAVVAGHALYIFGGYDGSYKCDLHEFDFSLSRWHVVPAAGRRPRARYRATCVVHKQNMIIFGGHDGTRHLNDTHLFDLDTRIWHNLITEGTPPIPRDSHVSVVHGNSMYVFGGSSGSAMNDLHELQLPSTPTATARWRPIQTAGTEEPRHRFCHVAVCYNDSMYCFGGYDGANRLNDTIYFDFAVYDLSFEVPPSTIGSDLRCMINDSTWSDITFIVEDRPVYAHKLILTRCSYFQALFLGNMRESKLDTIRLEQVRYPIFMQALEYLYTDHVRVSLNDAMELFEAADLFCIPRLKTMCEKRMLQSITVENGATIFHAADMHSALALRQKAKKYILSHFEETSKTAAFEEMGRQNIDLVFELLQSR